MIDNFCLSSLCSSVISLPPYWAITVTCVSNKFSILNSQFSILNSQFSILNSQFSILNSQFSILNSQFSILNSQFSILNSQLAHNQDISQFPLHPPRILFPFHHIIIHTLRHIRPPKLPIPTPCRGIGLEEQGPPTVVQRQPIHFQFTIHPRLKN